MESSLSIGEVARRAGVRTSALRYYERRGLLPPPDRVSGQRRYRPDAVEHVLLIRFCQRVGFSLDEVSALLAPATAKRAKQRWRALVDAKLAAVDAQIAEAQAVREVLEHSRACDCLSLQDCSFVAGQAPRAAA